MCRTIIKQVIIKFPFCLPPPFSYLLHSLPEGSPALLQNVPPKTFAFPYFEGSFQPFIRSSYFPGRFHPPAFPETGRAPVPARREAIFLRPPLGVALWFRGCEAYNIHESVAPI